MTGMTIHTARESTIHIVGIRNVRLTTNIGPPGTRATELVSMVVALEGSPFLGGTSESKSCTARVSTFVCVGFTVSAQADAGPNPNTAIHNFDRWDYWSGTHYALCEFHFSMWEKSREAESLEEFWLDWTKPKLPLDDI